MMRKLAFSVLVASLGLMGLDDSTAAAATVYEKGDGTVDIFGMGRVAYGVQNGNDTTAHGPQVGLARLGGRATHKRWGSILVQFEGNTGNVDLLDLQLELNFVEQLKLRAGFYRNSFSADVQIGFADMPFYRRSLLVSLAVVPIRLLGAELIATHDAGSFSAQLQAGLFMPPGAPLNTLAAGIDRQLVVRGLVELDMGLGFHAAISNVMGDNFSFGPDDAKLDLAAFYKKAGLLAQAEATFVLSTARMDKTYGFYVLGHYEIPIADTGFSIAPGARYDLVDQGEATHRLTGALDWRIFGPNLYAAANISVQWPQDIANNIEFFLYLQGTF